MIGHLSFRSEKPFQRPDLKNRLQRRDYSLIITVKRCILLKFKHKLLELRGSICFKTD